MSDRVRADKQKQDDFWRFERKFFVEGRSLHQIENIVLRHPSIFRKLHHPRQVNNIYYDTVGFDSFWANVDGLLQRQKYRIRWYGPTYGMIEKPVLECKIRNGFLGGKEHYDLRPFEIDDRTGLEGIRRSLLDSDLPANVRQDLSLQQPRLLNHYRRKYYISRDGRFRITIDDDLRYYPVEGLRRHIGMPMIDRDNAVMELKYSSSDINDRDAREIMNDMPFRMTKNSKYVTGVEKLYRLEVA